MLNSHRQYLRQQRFVEWRHILSMRISHGKNRISAIKIAFLLLLPFEVRLARNLKSQGWRFYILCGRSMRALDIAFSEKIRKNSSHNLKVYTIDIFLVLRNLQIMLQYMENLVDCHFLFLVTLKCWNTGHLFCLIRDRWGIKMYCILKNELW